MKRLLYFFFFFFGWMSIHAQNQNLPSDICGNWYGALDLSVSTLRLELRIEEDGQAWMRSPDQHDGEDPFNHVEYAGGKLTLKMTEIDLVMEFPQTGKERLMGSLVQYGTRYELEMGREAIAPIKKTFPQTPTAPFTYSTEDLDIQSTATEVSLSGTLCLPENEDKKAPLVIMISGSGPQNRNEEILGHEPFWVLADHLAKENIASFRYDDRGVGKSTGDFAAATSLDFAEDVKAIIAFFKSQKEHTARKIGLLGHSEGGLVAAMVAADNPDVDFVISLAGPGIDGKRILEKQNKAMMIAEGMSEESAQQQADFVMGMCDIVMAEQDPVASRNALRNYLLNQAPEGVLANMGGIDAALETYDRSLNTAWMRFFLSHDPSEDWKRVRCPVLALNGTVDTQVEAASNLNAIEFALRRARNSQYKILALKQHNHLFQPSLSGALSEYGKIEISISELTLESITHWIKAL